MTLSILRSPERLLAHGALEFAAQRFEDANRTSSIDERLAASQLLYEAALGVLRGQQTDFPAAGRELTVNINVGVSGG